MTELVNDELARRLAHMRTLEPEDMLEELLATIHGDGGHRSDDVGLAQAVVEAQDKFLEAWGRPVKEVDAKPVAWQVRFNFEGDSENAWCDVSESFARKHGHQGGKYEIRALGVIKESHGG
jgi:hypothetical protein